MSLMHHRHKYSDQLMLHHQVVVAERDLQEVGVWFDLHYQLVEVMVVAMAMAEVKVKQEQKLQDLKLAVIEHQ